MSESQSKTSLELNDKDLDDINKENNNDIINKDKLKNIINRNRGHSELGRQLTYNKKLENELDSLPNDIRKFFLRSLDKYKFKLEVYVPHSMVISKKEYYQENYMLNNLVRTEDIIKGKKNQIAHISKETKKFSHQYEFVRKENIPHQLNYLSKIEKMYKNKGYNTTGINYKKDDNIFNPSFLLDTKYGINSHSDVIKYGQNNYKKEYKIDKMLLNKFDEYIQKKNKGVQRKESNEFKIKQGQNILEDDDEKQQFMAQIKKQLEEQIKIQNMTQKEYFNHSKKIKKEIQSLKNTINNLDELNDYFTKKNFTSKSNINKIVEKTNKSDIIEEDKKEDKKENKKENKKIVDFNSNIFLSSKGMKDYSKEKNQILPDIRNSLKIRSMNKSVIIPRDKIGLKKQKIELKKTIVPKLLLKEINNTNNIKPLYLSERKKKEIEKEKKLTQLYDKLNNRKSNTFFPYNQVNQYFTKYSPRRIPLSNSDRGSNIHGLVEEVQNIINENNFAGFAKLNDIAKRDIGITMKNKNDENLSKKNVDDDFIINLDNKILGMHYDFTDKLLSNKKEEFNIE